jgi:CheY-like chemotaxis protein
VLVAEDNPTNQRVAALLLNRLGYRAEVVADGQEAVDAVARVPYDAVLMDCQMPRMDGFEAARRIRETETASRVPIIAMTAGARATHREECLAAGMDDYVSKPVTLEALDEVLTRWMPGGGERAEVGRVNRNARSHV